MTGSDRKTSCLIRGDFASDFNDLDEDTMDTNFGFVGVTDLICGGPNIFLVYLEVAFGCCKGLGKVLTHQIGGEARPKGEKSGVDCLGPGFEDQNKSGAVQILHKVGLCDHLVGVV